MKKTILMLCAVFCIAVVGTAAKKSESQTIVISSTENGFEPNKIDAKPGLPVVLKVTRKTDATCATQISIPSKKIKKDLPLNKEVTVKLDILEKGEIRFYCGMNMMEGVISVR